MRRILIMLLVSLTQVNGIAQTLSDTAHLEAFMDGVIRTHLRDKHIAGATVSVIRDGKVLLAKGYGFSDEQNQTPVVPNQSLFRIGSISKMFTWISVMQLVSQGKLKLDEDINQYLKDFKIPATYPQPITLKDIMTHTPGFEDKVIGLFAKDSSALKPLGEILSREMPARVRPPGTFASYSNHGTGMAAYIVEQVSGMTFNEYVEKNILGPLQMTSTSFRQPLPSGLKPYMSKGYTFAGGEFKEKPFEYVPLYPVGAAASSATDMAHFMDAILHNGRWGSAQILDSATLALMEGYAHRHHPDVNPMRYGFMDMSRNGVEIIGHGGDTFWFHSLMALLPASRTGIFVSFNTDKGGGTYMEVLDEFMDYYYPENSLKGPLRTDKKFLQRFAGSYRANRYPYHDITTISSVFNDAKISAADSLRIKLQVGENVKYYVPVDSLTFRQEHASDVLAFPQNDKGEITQMFIGNLPIIAFDRVTGLMNAGLHLTIIILVILVALTTLLYWPFGSWMRRGYQSHRVTKDLPASSRWVAWLNFLVLVIFYAGLISVVNGPEAVVFGIATPVRILLVLPFVCIVLTLWMVLHAFRLAGDSRYNFSSRLFYAIITLTGMAALWQLYFWNFIGFHY